MRLKWLVVLCVGMATLPAFAANELVYVATRGGGNDPGQATDSRPQGVYAARLDESTGHLTPLGLQADLPRGEWLVFNPRLPVLYASNSAGSKQSDSAVSSFSVDSATGKLKFVNKVDAGGRQSLNGALDADSDTIFSANHGTGDVTALPVEADGSLGAMVSAQKDASTGPKPPAAHGVVVDPSHKYVLVADFTAGRIFIDRFDGKTRALSPAATPFVAVPAGAGPRHLLFSPDGRFLFLLTETSAEVRSYRWNASSGTLQLVQSVAAGPKDATEFALTPDGRFLYVSLRSLNSVAAFRVDAGRLTEIQRVPSQGQQAWSLNVDPTGRWLLVANEGSGSVVEFKIDQASGKLGATGESLSMPNPAAVAFYRR